MGVLYQPAGQPVSQSSGSISGFEVFHFPLVGLKVPSMGLCTRLCRESMILASCEILNHFVNVPFLSRTQEKRTEHAGRA